MQTPIDAYNKLTELEIELNKVQFEIDTYRAYYPADGKWQLAMDQMQTSLDTRRNAIANIKTTLEMLIIP